MSKSITLACFITVANAPWAHSFSPGFLPSASHSAPAISPDGRLSRAPDAPSCAPPDAPSCALSYRGWIPPSSFHQPLHGPASSRAHPDRSRLASIVLYSDIPDSWRSGLFYNAYTYADTPVYPIYRAIPIVRQRSMTFQRVLYCSTSQIPILVRSLGVLPHMYI